MVSEITRGLEKSIRAEIALYEEYLKLLESEKRHVAAFRSEEVIKSSTRREDITFEALKLQEKREALIVAAKLDPKVRLSVLVKEHFKPADNKLLQPLIAKLRTVIEQSRKKAAEFAQVIDFSLGIINGQVSIISSATQNVNRAYNAGGIVKESRVPRYSRGEGTLKEA